MVKWQMSIFFCVVLFSSLALAIGLIDLVYGRRHGWKPIATSNLLISFLATGWVGGVLLALFPTRYVIMIALGGAIASGVLSMVARIRKKNNNHQAR